MNVLLVSGGKGYLIQSYIAREVQGSGKEGPAEQGLFNRKGAGIHHKIPQNLQTMNATKQNV